MKPEETKAHWKKVFEDLNKHDLGSFLASLTPDCVIHTSSGDVNAKAFDEMQKGNFKSFPDQKFEHPVVLVDGDNYALRYTVSGTHKGEFRGIPPTGKKLKYMVTAFGRVVGDKTAEFWLLGGIPAPKK